MPATSVVVEMHQMLYSFSFISALVASLSVSFALCVRFLFWDLLIAQTVCTLHSMCRPNHTVFAKQYVFCMPSLYVRIFGIQL